MAALVSVLGDPQRSYPVIHVTGTNGKTSTARMIESLLRARGLRTGLFTSPHLSSIRERIVVDGQPVSAETFVAAYDELAPYLALVDGQQATQLSFFEVLTGMAFAIFADVPVDVAVIEVGLGGTWDATNVADGAVAVVTPISLDHTAYLGGTVEEIATDKAGIIKPGAVAGAGPAAAARGGGPAAPGRRGRAPRWSARGWSSGSSTVISRSAASGWTCAGCAATTPTSCCRCSAPTRPVTRPCAGRGRGVRGRDAVVWAVG